MQYRKIPKTGEEISVLGFGCMRFATKFGKIDVELAKSQILQAIDSGVNYLDTAWFYHMGESESFLGERILNGEYRQKVNIATKMPCFMISKKKQIEEIFQSQLKKLNVEQIDYYLLHALNLEIFKKMLNFDIIDFINEMKKQGKIKYMGFSFHGTHKDFIEIIDSYDWDFCQVQFNILDENFQAGTEGIKYAASKNIGVFVMSPLRGGALSLKMPPDAKKLYSNAKISKTPTDWALSFILNHEEITMVLSGMNDEKHIMENIETATNTLPNSFTDYENEIIKKVQAIFNEKLIVKCTGCDYCNECPKKINIKAAFKSLNDHSMFSKTLSKFVYIFTAVVQNKDGKTHWASDCISCKKCEKVCPQNLEICKDLKLVSKKLETIDVKIIAKIINKFKRKKV